MNTYEKSLEVMDALFGKDFQFALATSNNNAPSVRIIDTFYENSCFYIVTYGKSQKVKEIMNNPKVSLCNNLYSFNGNAYHIGHPLDIQNSEIREKLIKVFEPWYFKHNNENDENMCYVKIELDKGFLYKDGSGYKVDFTNQQAEEFPFVFDILEV